MVLILRSISLFVAKVRANAAHGYNLCACAAKRMHPLTICVRPGGGCGPVRDAHEILITNVSEFSPKPST